MQTGIHNPHIWLFSNLPVIHSLPKNSYRKPRLEEYWCIFCFLFILDGTFSPSPLLQGSGALNDYRECSLRFRGYFTRIYLHRRPAGEMETTSTTHPRPHQPSLNQSARMKHVELHRAEHTSYSTQAVQGRGRAHAWMDIRALYVLAVCLL